MAVKYLAGDRLIGTAAERIAMPTGGADVDIDFTEYADQSTADTAWSDSGSSEGQENWARVNVSNDNLAFSLSGTDKNHTMSYDLQQSEALNGSNPSDSAWVVRFTLNFSTVSGGNNAQAMKFVLCDDATSNLNSTNTDFIGMKLTPSANKYYSIDGDNTNTDASTDNEVALTLATSTIYYFEIKRLTTTSYIINRYNTDFGTVQDSATGTCASSTDGLRYFRFVEITGGSVHTFAGVFDNFQLWTGVTSAVPLVQPNLSNGAIFEESDTGKHYMFDGSQTWNEM